MPFPLPKSRETKDAVVFNGFHLIGKSLIDPRFMIMHELTEPPLNLQKKLRLLTQTLSYNKDPTRFDLSEKNNVFYFLDLGAI